MSIYISSALVVSPSALDEPLENARIGYASIIPNSVLTGTSGVTNYPLINILNPATYERYKPVTATACTIDIDASTATEVDYLGIQGRGISNVKIYYSSNGTSYTLADEFNPVGSAIMGLFESMTHRYYRIVLTGTDLVVIALKLGKALAMQRAIYGGHTPITMGRVNAVRPNMSETGQYLGASIQRKGFSTKFNWSNLKAAWYRANFDLFVDSEPRVNPFFIAWRPSSYPNEVAYCWAMSDITPSNTGTKDFMEVSIKVEGFRDAQ